MRVSFTIHRDRREDVLDKLLKSDKLWSIRAFTLMECIFAVMLISGCAVALYSAITWGFLNIRFAREELKATQIMLDKMEVVRLCTWDQILSNNFIPPTFSVPYSGSVTDKTAGTPIYSGRIGIDKPVLGLNYENGMRLVTISLTWSNRDIVHRREFSTYISQYGVNKFH
jgi:hypothetical protein